MGKNVLITEITNPIGQELGKVFSINGYNVIGTNSSKTNSVESSQPSGEIKGGKIISLKWTKSSPVSARNVVLQARNKFETIDIAIIIQIFPGQNKLFNEIEFHKIESLIDENAIGPLFLAREILKHYYQNRPKETKILSFIQYSESPLNYSTPLEAFLRKGIEGFIKSQAQINENPEIIMNLFFSRINRIESPREYAEYIFLSLTERAKKTNGKILNYSGKRRLF